MKRPTTPNVGQSADDSDEDEHHRQIGTATDQRRTQHVVDHADETGPHQEPGSRDRVSAPVEPDHGGNENRHRTELRDAGHDHEHGEDPHRRHTCDQQADHGQQRLRERGQEDAQRDAAGRLRGQHHRVLSLFTGQPAREAAQVRAQLLAVAIQEDDADSGQRELEQHHPSVADSGEEPGHDAAAVGASRAIKP